MSSNIATGLAITNPLVKYRALVATKAIAPDNGQLRLALHLQKLYDRLKDYEPEVEYSQRLDQISRAVKSQDGASREKREAEEVPAAATGWRGLWAAKERRDSLALTRRLTSHESAMQMQSPQGLMLHGEVGTGKSMLVDLFAECLPNRKKRRWHFNTFMLETFAKLEAFRRDRTVAPGAGIGGAQDDDYSLMWLAKDMIQTSPILFLDEFQMPDRVASKILTNLMTSFFHLGGVLVATSNRMPEELAKASGIEFQPPPSRMEALGWQFGFRRRQRSIYAGRNEFAAFLDVLKARCEVWEMQSGRDYRRLESGSVAPVRAVDVEEQAGLWELDGQDDLVAMKEGQDAEAAPMVSAEIPKYYHLSSSDKADHMAAIQNALEQASGGYGMPITYTPATMSVYGRTIIIPRTYNGVAKWTFTQLCKTTLGPADYTTLASTYHTLIITDVPILTSLMKNEARRFITLLDALYECRCKLFITAAAGPDDLFFPDKRAEDSEGGSDEAIQSETFSEAYQDATAPFRPNISTNNPNYAEPDPEPNYTHARFAGLLNANAIEDDPPNKPHKNPFGRSFGRTDAEMERQPIDPDGDIRFTPRRPIGPGGLDFGQTTAFTGEDERFAYKRAQSRLWELCGARWWARSEKDWHRPLPAEVRRWERSFNERLRSQSRLEEVASGDVRIGDSTVDETRDERSFRRPESSHSPFRTVEEGPPKFSWVHAWGTMKWGAKAGKWGQGVEGLKEKEGEEKR